MASAEVYSSASCYYCIKAKQLLEAKGISYQEFIVDGDPELRTTMMNKSGRHTTPQIWINNKHIGGCDDLYSLERSGELELLLAGDEEH